MACGEALGEIVALWLSEPVPESLGVTDRHSVDEGQLEAIGELEREGVSLPHTVTLRVQESVSVLVLQSEALLEKEIEAELDGEEEAESEAPERRLTRGSSSRRRLPLWAAAAAAVGAGCRVALLPPNPLLLTFAADTAPLAAVL